MKNNNELSPKIIMLIMAIIIVPVMGLIIWGQFNKPGLKTDSLLNKQAPSFSLQDKNGNIYTPESLKGKNVVLFFSEGLACYPACWQQIASFGTDARFNNAETMALSVVMDSPEDWQKTPQKMEGIDKANIIFDKGGQVSKEYGMMNVKSSMRQGTSPGHTYVIINKQGIIKYVLDDPSMAVRNDLIASELAKVN